MTTRSAPLIGGSFDGLRIRLDGAELPLTIALDGDTYDLSGATHARHYRARRNTAWGERRRFDSSAKRIVLHAISRGATVAEAAERAGFSPSPVYTARAKDGGFRSALDAAQRHKRRRRIDDELPTPPWRSEDELDRLFERSPSGL